MDLLLRTGRMRRGSLGVTIQPVTSDIAASLGLSEVRGALVNSVALGSAAERAGLRQGDVIVEINRQAVRTAADVRGALERAGGRPSLVLINRRGMIFLTVQPRG